RPGIKSFIGHHVIDSHDFTLFSDYKEGKYYGFPLPVILWDEGVHFFSSAKFHHGKDVVESKGKFFALNYDDGKIYRTDAEGTINVGENGLPTNDRPIDFSITKTVVAMILVAFLMIFIFR